MNHLESINPIFKALLSDWSQDYRTACLPAEGSIVTRSETVVKKYVVKYDDDGTIRYVPIKDEPPKIEE
jgi:hypothetical protein|tara:strand:- start:2846 stop:3052 length:207 start_codon:yes stop_codon:yes gene_type:complete